MACKSPSQEVTAAGEIKDHRGGASLSRSQRILNETHSLLALLTSSESTRTSVSPVCCPSHPEPLRPLSDGSQFLAVPTA